jgi:hypothetical protein
MPKRDFFSRSNDGQKLRYRILLLVAKKQINAISRICLEELRFLLKRKRFWLDKGSTFFFFKEFLSLF